MFRTQAMYRDNLPFDGNATIQYNPVYYTAHYKDDSNIDID